MPVVLIPVVLIPGVLIPEVLANGWCCTAANAVLALVLVIPLTRIIDDTRIIHKIDAHLS